MWKNKRGRDGFPERSEDAPRRAVSYLSRVAALLPLTTLVILLAAPGAQAQQQQQQQQTERGAGAVDWKRLDAAMGRPGTLLPGDVYRFSMPRGDLHVIARGVTIRPAFALGSWAAFKLMPNGEAMVMGDLVLGEDEVAPVMTKLQQGGVEQSALHHHIMGEAPRVLYMHLMGHGDAMRMAETIRAALALTKTPPPPATTAAAPATAAAADPGLDTKQIEAIIGRAGRMNGGVFQLSVPRAERITDGGMEVPPSMGVATALNFQPTGEGRAAITGDFVMLAAEVNPVIRALRAHNIEVTSLHNHSLADEPRLFYMHFWANDDAVKLARGLRAALDQTNSVKGESK